MNGTLETGKDWTIEQRLRVPDLGTVEGLNMSYFAARK